MEQMARDFFNQLYTADQHTNPRLILDLIHPKITEGMNQDLCKDFTEEEISDALFQIGPLKAPGPDGFPARFFQ